MKRILATILALSLLVFAMAACGGKQASTGKSNVGEAQYGSEYPIECDTKLTYWMPMSAVISASAANFGELPVAQELSKRTGIDIEYVHPSLTNASEKFNLMIASGELTDIIQFYGMQYYPGGPQKAIDDGVIIPLNDYIDAFAPNLKKVLDDYPHIAAEAKTDAGNFAAVGTVAIEPELLTTGGLVIREDWLEDANLEIPETIEEWEVVLRSFKEKQGASAPLSGALSMFSNGAFTGAFETQWGFYRNGDKVVYGPATENWKEFLTLINKWYEEGLFDPNFATIDNATITANMLNGVSGVTYGGLGGTIGALTSAAKGKAKYTGTAYPTHKKGEVPEFGQATNPMGTTASITTKCKDPELAMKFLDYGYSEEGRIFMNFGTEGVSYNMVDGYPTYTELITNNPKGLSMSQALITQCFGGQSLNSVQDTRYLEQYAGLPNQQVAAKRWINNKGQSHRIPRVYIEDARATEYSTKFTDISSYVNEMFIKFVSGDEPLSNFDKYIQNMKKMGLDDIITLQQDAYNRFLAR